MSTQSIQKKGGVAIPLERLAAHRLLRTWRKKNAKLLRGLDAVKAIRELRMGSWR